MGFSMLLYRNLLNSNSYLRSSRGALKFLYDVTLARSSEITGGIHQINNNKETLQQGGYNNNNRCFHNSSEEDDNSWNNNHHRGSRDFVYTGGVLVSFSLFGLSSKDEKEETPEDKLIITIKRSILCIQREQYEKAERLLHLALRMSQDLRHEEGTTYVFDILANLAMEREQFKKAEKLFAEVMRRLIQDGHSEDSPQILHISGKIAHIAQLQGELDKAKTGFEWTIGKIENKLKQCPGDKDLEELLGLTKNWFGQLLMKIAKYSEAKKLFNEAYTCLVDVYGRINEEAITILNNLSVACVNLDEFEEAKSYLNQAMEIVKELKDSTQEAILQANLGLVFLREGLTEKAKEQCSRAYRLAKQQKNAEAIEQSEYCLNELKAVLEPKSKKSQN